MKQNSSLNPNFFHNIPQDLKRIIFEYVPSLDYASLSLVCRDFFTFLQKNPELWARQVFKEFLDVVPKQNPFFEESCLEHNFELNLSKIKFDKMTDSQRLLVQHHNIMKQWKSFFSLFLCKDDCKSFIDDISSTLSKPNHPPPCLKKDAYYFPTNTLFQNFLTEVYFGVDGRPFIQEKKQILAEQIAKNMNEHLLSRKVDKDRLVALRWYLFNNEKTTKKANSASNAKASLISSQSKIIKKEHTGQKKAREIPSKVQEIKNIQNEKSVRKDEVEAYKKFNEKDAGVEEFYWMLNNLMENHCKMVFSYLTSIHDPYLLITEYTRLWNKYALLIMEFSQIFNPLAELFNTLYEDVCKGLPSFPKFSTWRLMVKAWISQVFSNLSYFIGEAFRAILMKVRSQKKSLYMQKPGNTGTCSFCDTTQCLDGSNAPYDHFFYKFSRTDKEREDIAVEDLVHLLNGFYLAVDDISYNEFSIFYWDCNPSDKRTPKGILESLVLQDTQLFYEHSNACFWQGQKHFKKLMSQDIKIIEEIMGKQVAYEIRQLQSSVMKKNLTAMVNQAVENAQDITNLNSQSNETVESSVRSDTNLREIFNSLAIDDQTQKQVLESKQMKNSVAAKLEENSQVIDPYMTYLKKEQEEIISQGMEFEDMRSHRVFRGFIVAGEKYNKFFELGLTPSLTEIQKVGLEGKDIQEEVEPADEPLILL